MFTKTFYQLCAVSASLLLVVALVDDCRSQTGQPDRSAVKCYEDSPERRGEEGCTILATQPIAGSIGRTVYWHIDRFESLDAARKEAGPSGVATEAHGGIWLMTVEGKTKNHHGGRHVALIG